MSRGEFTIGPAEPLRYRPEIVRRDPEPFNAADPRDVVRAALHHHFTSPGSGAWDYLESFVRGELLVVRLLDDVVGPISIEVELAEPVNPEDWQFLDVWIVEFMDTGRSEPASVTDGVTTYRWD